MQHTSVLIIVEGPDHPPLTSSSLPPLRQLIQHFSLFEQTLILLYREGQSMDEAYDKLAPSWVRLAYEDQPAGSPTFNAWLDLQSDEQDYFIVGDGPRALQLAQTLHQRFKDAPDQNVWLVKDALWNPPPLDQVEISCILADDFIN